MEGHTNWDTLTKEELVHLLEGDDEVEALILEHHYLEVFCQKRHKMACPLCESIDSKLEK